MAPELAGEEAGVAERFVPEEMRGQLIEAEHLARYRWAAGLARGARVLDAGCGTAYGSALLAAPGREVTGVDRAAAVLDAVRDEMPEGVTLRTGDVRALDAPDGAFDTVVCFEVIEHVDDPWPVLDELVRVLAPGGLLLVSSPNRGVYPEGNPHHLHELVPAELREALAARLGRVELVRQQVYMASLVLGDEHFARGGGHELEGLTAAKLVADAAGSETYVVAMASDGDLPAPAEVAMVTRGVEMRRWFAHMDAQQEVIEYLQARERELEDRLADVPELQALLREAEEKLAAVVDLEQAVQEARQEREAMRAERDHTQQLLDRSRRVLDDVMGSISWRVTKPLRKVKQSAS